MLIEVKNLHKSFGENQVLRGIDVPSRKAKSSWLSDLPVRERAPSCAA